MSTITQASLQEEKRLSILESLDYQELLSKEEELKKELETFRESIDSIYEELKTIRKEKVRMNKKAGTYKKLNKIIQDYVKSNPGVRYSQIINHLETVYLLKSPNGSVSESILRKYIKEKDGFYYVSTGPNSKPQHGSITDTVLYYAKTHDWFSLKDVSIYSKNTLKNTIISSNTIAGVLYYYKQKFDVDINLKYYKYRLKDEFRV